MHQTWTQGLNVVMSNASNYLNTFRFRCCEDGLSAITLDRLGSFHIYGGLQLFIILALITFTVALMIACWLDLKGTNIIELIKEWAQTKNKKNHIDYLWLWYSKDNTIFYWGCESCLPGGRGCTWGLEERYRGTSGGTWGSTWRGGGTCTCGGAWRSTSCSTWRGIGTWNWCDLEECRTMLSQNCFPSMKNLIMKSNQQERILCNKCMIKTVVLLCVKEAIELK